MSLMPEGLASNHTEEAYRPGSRWGIAAIALILIAVGVGGFLIGFTAAGGGVPTASAQTGFPPEFDVFWEAWNYVENEFYYQKPTAAERTYGAVRGMLATLGDDYTAFVQPSIASIERENIEGLFGGIGAYVQLNEFGQLIIAYPFPEHPAAEAGLRAGDVILSVDNQPLENLTLAEGTALIRGPLGTVVHLEIYRPGTDETFEVDVERVEIKIPTVRAEMLEDGIGYVALYRFNGVAAEQLESEIAGLLEQEPRALIFDLRGNPGGLLDEAVDVSDLFLSEGLVATQRTSLYNEPRVFNATTGDLAEDIPLVVLIDGGSASASEIVAGAIKDRNRGVLIGTHSFGKGSVQLVHDLSDGSQLRITYGAWYTPNETDLRETGIIPDIEVEIPETLTAGDDPWLDTAIQYINDTYPLRQ